MLFPARSHLARTGDDVKEFVSLHKGSLRVDSELEHGTTFVIELPSMFRVQEFDAAMVDPETLARIAA